MHCAVNIITDFSFGALSHKFVLPPPVPPAPPAPTVSVEMIAPMMWTFGFLMNANKWTNGGGKLVLHKGLFIMLDGHDCGMMIPDVVIPPPNLLYPVMWLNSSRKPFMKASAVKMGGTAVALSGMVAMPPIPMMTCGEPVSAPTCLSPINGLTNTVLVGFSIGDLIAGVIAVAISIAVDLIANKVGGDSPAFSGIGNALAESVMSKFLLGGKGADFAKALAGALGGLAISAAQGNPSFSLGAGLPFFGGQVSWTAHPDPGSPSFVLQGNAMGVQGDTAGNSQTFGTPAAAPATPPT